MTATAVVAALVVTLPRKDGRIAVYTISLSRLTSSILVAHGIGIVESDATVTSADSRLQEGQFGAGPDQGYLSF